MQPRIASVFFSALLFALVPQVSMAAPQAKPGVEFFDPLSDIYSSHVSSHSSDPSNYLLGFEGGEYVVKTVNPAYDRSPTVAAGGVYGDVDVAVDARLYGETAGSYLKVECRHQPDGSGSYRLTIDPAASKFQLVRWDGATPVSLVSWTYSDSIAVQNLSNRMELRCQGDAIDALINGDSVASTKDATYPSGEVAIGDGRFSNSGTGTVDARFKNLRVSLHSAGVASANAYCANGRLPSFALGLADLKARLGVAMGEPIECEHPNANNGDSLQQTTMGVALYRQRTNMPTFTDGSTHWGLTSGGVVRWVGQSVDPPFWQFAGAWYLHGLGVTITGDGTGEAQWRTYRWCGDPGVTEPCDYVRGNEIVGGGHATLALDGRQGPVARGQVLDSSDSNMLAPGSFTLALSANGLGELRQSGSGIGLCGPWYPSLATPDIQNAYPCGA